MQFFANWWERLPRGAAPTLLAFLAIANAVGHIQGFVKYLPGPTAFTWG